MCASRSSRHTLVQRQPPGLVGEGTSAVLGHLGHLDQLGRLGQLGVTLALHLFASFQGRHDLFLRSRIRAQLPARGEELVIGEVDAGGGVNSAARVPRWGGGGGTSCGLRQRTGRRGADDRRVRVGHGTVPAGFVHAAPSACEGLSA
jgi:hypothetical protein